MRNKGGPPGTDNPQPFFRRPFLDSSCAKPATPNAEDEEQNKSQPNSSTDYIQLRAGHVHVQSAKRLGLPGHLSGLFGINLVIFSLC
jgi:hypothetical protein